MTKKPLQIKRLEKHFLFTKWSDGFEAFIPLDDLRRNCPCAECTGEQIGDIVYSRPKPVKIEPGAFDLVDIKPIGNYAIAVKWANGHDTGIYNWEKLREIFNEFQVKTDEEKQKHLSRLSKESKKIQLNVL